MTDTDSAPTSFKSGAPSRPGRIPLSVPFLHGNEWKYIKDCLDTNWVSSVGSYVTRFEESVAAQTGVAHAAATINGTAALHLALLVAGVEPDDEVIVPTLTFVASANAVRYLGAWPVFMDVDPNFHQLDVEKLAAFLENECRPGPSGLINKHTDRRIKAVMPVDIMGHPVDMDSVLDLARRFGLMVVEDAAEGMGVKYLSGHGGEDSRWVAVGSQADIACFSFNGNKTITTGGGGMIVTDRAEWAEKARYLATQAKDDPVEYDHEEIGYNYRLTNIQAAMGVAQMELLDEYVAIKRASAARYSDALSSVDGLSVPLEADWAKSTFWLYTLLVDEKIYGCNSRDLMAALEERGIESRPLWKPLHTIKPFWKSQAYRIEVADRLWRDGLSLPNSTGLSSEEREFVIASLMNLRL